MVSFCTLLEVDIMADTSMIVYKVLERDFFPAWAEQR